MQEKLSSLVIALLAKSGVLADLPEGSISAINKHLESINIDASLTWKAFDNVMSKEDAKTNPALYEHFTNQVKRDFDAGIDAELKNYKFDEETVFKIKSAPSMIQKASLLAAKVKGTDLTAYNNQQLQQKIENLERTLSGNPVNHELIAEMQKDQKAVEDALARDAAAEKMEEKFFGWQQ